MESLFKEIDLVKLGDTIQGAAIEIGKEIALARSAIERGFCSTHQQFKSDIWNDGALTCESCFEEFFHHNEFVGCDVEDMGEL